MLENDTTIDRLFLALKMTVPYLLIGLLFVLDLISAPAPLSLILQAPFLFMTVYYWSLFRPTLMPTGFVFMIGLLFDILTGFPLGVNALLLALTRMIIATQRRYIVGQTYMMIWLGFVLSVTVFLFSQWVIICLTSLSLLPIMMILAKGLIGIVVFPFILVFLYLTHQILPAPQADIAQTRSEQRGSKVF